MLPTALADQLAEMAEIWLCVLVDRKAPSLFGEWLRKPRVVALDDVPGYEETEEAGGYTAQELRRLRQLELVVRGMSRADTKQEMFLAVEISRTIDLEDVDRAIERAWLLARGGAKTLAAVAGKSLTDRARLRAQETGTIVRLLDSVA